MPDRDVYGYTIFCDDVRQEVNAKLSYMGIFPFSVSIEGTFPAAIGKLCLSIYFFELQKLAMARDWEVPLLVYGPGQTLETPAAQAVIPILPTSAQENLKRSPTYESEENLYAIGSVLIIFNPLVIHEPGWIRVRARYKDELIKLGSLRVDQGTIPS